MTGQAPAHPLRLRAADAEDLAILSAALQDAIVPVADMDYFASERMFAFVCNRFKWEVGASSADPTLGSDEDDDALAGTGEARPFFWRTNCGVRIHGVTGVRYQNVDLKQRGRMLDLLTLDLAGPADAPEVVVHCAESVRIALSIERLQVFMEDLGEPWPTITRPDHGAADHGAADHGAADQASDTTGGAGAVDPAAKPDSGAFDETARPSPAVGTG